MDKNMLLLIIIHNFHKKHIYVIPRKKTEK